MEGEAQPLLAKDDPERDEVRLQEIRFLKNETPEQHKARFRSIQIILLTNLFTGIGFSILLSTMWPFLAELGGTSTFLGILVSGFSFGQLISSPFWGYWTNKYSISLILHISIILRLLGNLGYAMAGAIPEEKDWFLFEMRLLVGFGAGSMAVCSAYAAEATTTSERTAAVANLAASGGLGFIFGPLFGICFGSLKPGFYIGPFVVNFLTAPAYVACLMSIINHFLLFFWFRDNRISVLLEKQQVHAARVLGPVDHLASNNSVNATSIKEVAKTKPYHDSLAVYILLFCYLASMVTLSVFETISVPVTMDEYGWDSQQAAIYNGIIAGLGGLEAVAIFILTKPLAKKYGERQVMMLGALTMVLGNIILLPFGGPAPTEWISKGDDDGLGREGCVGLWCVGQSRITFGQYVAGSFMLCAGYPIVSVMSFAIFSKALGPFKQGYWMGIINAMGSLARGVGPLAITRMYASQGPRMVYASLGLLALFVMLLTGVFWRRLVPHELLG